MTDTTANHPDRPHAPQVHAMAWQPLPDQQVVTTAGGVTMHIVDSGELPANRVSLIWNYGVAQGTVQTGLPGAATMVPQLMMEGTASRTGSQIAEAFDFAGAMTRSRAVDQYTVLDVMGLNDSTPRMLRVMADVYANATIDPRVFDSLLVKAVNQRRLQLTQPMLVAQEAVGTSIAGAAHPYLQPVSPEKMATLTRDDVWQAYRTGTARTGLHIFFGGKLDGAIRDALFGLADALRPQPVSDPYVCPIVPFSPESAGRRHIAMPQSLQTAVAAAIPAVPRQHPDYNSLRLTVMALGGYFGSRLMTNIREEKGLTYGISASLMGTREGAYIYIAAQCAAGTADIVIAEIQNEMRRLADQPMGADELTRLKRYVASQLMSTLDTPLSVLEYYITHLTVGTPDDYFAAQFRAIESLTPDTIQRIAATYLRPDALHIVTAGA